MSEICLFVSTQKWDIESALIRRGTNCDWSHTGWFRKPDRMTFSAMSDGKGLAWRPLKANQQLLLLDAPGAEQSLALALKHEGAPYDYLNILGIILGKNWRTPGRYICNVAVFEYQKLAGFPLLNDKFIQYYHMAPDDILKSPLVSEAA